MIMCEHDVQKVSEVQTAYIIIINTERVSIHFLQIHSDQVQGIYFVIIVYNILMHIKVFFST